MTGDLLDERVGANAAWFRGASTIWSAGADGSLFFRAAEEQCASRKVLYYGDEKFGEVVTIDQAKGVLLWTLRKPRSPRRCIRRLFICGARRCRRISQAGALYRIGAWAAENGVDAAGRYRAGRDLLLRQPPRLINGEKLQQLASETAVNTANRIVLALEESVFAIQGPPGSGKTYAGSANDLRTREAREEIGRDGAKSQSHPQAARRCRGGRELKRT